MSIEDLRTDRESTREVQTQLKTLEVPSETKETKQAEY